MNSAQPYLQCFVVYSTNNTFTFYHLNADPGQVLVLTPVILATQEADIRRIVVQSQPR
jgi:hypothetical protein